MEAKLAELLMTLIIQHCQNSRDICLERQQARSEVCESVKNAPAFCVNPTSVDCDENYNRCKAAGMERLPKK